MSMRTNEHWMNIVLSQQPSNLKLLCQINTLSLFYIYLYLFAVCYQKHFSNCKHYACVCSFWFVRFAHSIRLHFISTLHCIQRKVHLKCNVLNSWHMNNYNFQIIVILFYTSICYHVTLHLEYFHKDNNGAYFILLLLQ